jgi:hypothetical protein
MHPFVRTAFLASACAALIAPAVAAAPPHARFDGLIGTWSCTNIYPSAMGGPARQTRTYARVGPGSVSMRVTGKGFERSGYLAYVAATKTWWHPFSYPNGNWAVESTKKVGVRRIYTGKYFNAATGATIPVRDIFVTLSSTRFTDLGQYQVAGAWKTGYSGTCTKQKT